MSCVVVDQPAGVPVAAAPQHGAVRPRVHLPGCGRPAAPSDGQQQAEGEAVADGHEC